MEAKCESFILTRGWSLGSVNAPTYAALSAAARHAVHFGGGNIVQPAAAGFVMRIGWVSSLIRSVKELPLDDGSGF
jgi:hypothetical protein